MTCWQNTGINSSCQKPWIVQTWRDDLWWWSHVGVGRFFDVGPCPHPANSATSTSLYDYMHSHTHTHTHTHTCIKQTNKQTLPKHAHQTDMLTVQTISFSNTQSIYIFFFNLNFRGFFKSQNNLLLHLAAKKCWLRVEVWYEPFWKCVEMCIGQHQLHNDWLALSQLLQQTHRLIDLFLMYYILAPHWVPVSTW